MLSIYLCDDENKQADYYYKIVKNFILFKNWDAQVLPPFHQPSELLKQLQPGQTAGLYFLDVDLKDSMDGFSLAKRIRSLDPRSFIVFLTAHGESAGLTFHYRVEAMDYITKGDDPVSVRSRIEACIAEAYQRYLNQAEIDDKILSFKSGSKDLYFRKREIISVSTSSAPHQLLIETPYCLLSVYGNLKDYEELLGPDFIRIKKSCLINKTKIQEIDYRDGTIRMENGALFQASIRKLRMLRLMADTSDLN